MILFSTILDITPAVTCDSFMRLVKEWNDGSSYTENVVPDVNWHGETSAHYGDDRLMMDVQYVRERQILAVRHRKITGEEDHTITWDTDFVVNLAERKISIRLDRTYSEDALVFNGKFSTPHFITMLIRHGFVADDVDIPVSREPWMITDGQAEALAGVFGGEMPYQLPIVYVAKTGEGEDPIPVGWLASRLKGAAHVLVESSVGECVRLRELADESTEEFGAVRIYYPSAGVPRKRFHFRSNTGDREERLEKVIRHVISYRNAQRVEPLYTWAGVNGAILQSEVEEIYETFDEDLRSLQERVEQLMRENESLAYENQRLRARLAADEGEPIIRRGEEEEFYPSEFREIVMDLLGDALRGVEVKTRRRDVLQDIMNSNVFEGICDERKQRVKNLFRGYKNLTGAMRQELAELGIEIREDGKHYKLLYGDDPRYMVTIPKTPSDTRSGANTAALVNKVMM